MTEETKETPRTPEEAAPLGKEYHVGDKVPGNVAPSGGSWKYDAENDEMELVEEPTKKD